MGRLAEAEGESKIYQDLRMKLFIDPDELKKQYAASPAWLQTLMNAFADGLNYYLSKHPEVKPRVIKRFEPWMALSFTEGSIGGDIEKVNLNQLQAFYGKGAGEPRRGTPEPLTPMPASRAEPAGSNGMAVAPSNTAAHHALLLINPHTSFFFRSELQMVSDEGLNAYGAVDLGPVLHLPGIQRARRLDAHHRAAWMRSTSISKRSSKKGDRFFYKYGSEERPFEASEITVPYKTEHGMAEKKFTVYRTHHGPVVREANGKWVSYPDDAGADQGAEAILHAHQGEGLQVVPADDGAEGELVEQHDLRRRRRRHRLLPRQLSFPAAIPNSTGPSRWTAAIRRPSGTGFFRSTRRRIC